MSDADRTSGDPSSRTALVRAAASVVGLVVLVAAVFWGIGTLRGDEDPVAADGADGAAVDTSDDAGDADGPAGDDAVDDGAAPADDGGDVDGEADGTDEDATDEDATDEDATGDTGGDESEGDESEVDDAGPDDRAVDPASVSVQVLDGFKQDGGTAADEVAGLLGDEGYQVVARNDALDYEATTVLYNPGQEEAARQLADDLGGAEVREQPGNLSTSVDLHVVVGSDRG